MKRLVAVVAVCIVAGGGTAHAQFSPEPSPTTTIPEGAVGTCVIQGISPAYDLADVATVIGVDVFLRCAETTERTSLHQLHVAGVNADALLKWLDLVELPADDVVRPQ